MLKHYLKVAVFGIVLGLCSTSVRAQADSIRTNQYGLVVKRVPLLTESRNGILVFESKDQTMRTWFDLRVNFDGAHYFDENALNELGSGATIRRLRFAMKTILYKNWTGEVDLDFAGGGLEVKDAFIGFKPGDKFYLKAGYFKEPISMETTTTSRYQTFIEEPYMTMFAPQRQLGINVTNWNKFYLAALGIHFNDVENMEVVTYSQNANKDFGTDEGYSLTGKLALRPIHTDKLLVHIAGSGSYRTPKTSSEFANAVRFSTRDMTNINRKKFIDSDDISKVKSSILYGAELATSYKNFKLSGEYLATDVTREEGLENYKASGFYVGGAWLIFGGKYNYNGEEGEFAQISRGKEWGDIELAFRFDYINLNDSKAQIMGGSANGYTGGVTYHVNPNVKLMLNYSYIDHDRYANGKGKLFVGTDSEGNLTKDYSKVTEGAGKGGADYGFIQARFEIDF